MRSCAAGTVRPLSSNEPLLASAADQDSPAQGQGLSAEAAPDPAEGTVSVSAPCQALIESGRPRRKRKAAKAAIDAALQTLADAQVRAPCRDSLLSGCLSALYKIYSAISWIPCMHECRLAISVAKWTLSMSLDQCRLTIQPLVRMVRAASCKDGLLQESRLA